MDEQSKRKALRKYFAPKPKLGLPILMLVGGILGIIAYLSDAQSFGACGLVGFLLALLGAAILVGGGKVGTIPSDARVDEWFQEDLTRIVKQSLGKTGVDQSELVKEPIPVAGPILWATNGVPTTDLLWKKGADGWVRFAIYRITVILLTDQLLAAYECDFNFLKNVALNEGTQEYHYQDVVSVSTQEESTSYTLPNGVSLISSQAFRLSVASAESIKVIIGATKMSEITGGPVRLTTKAEEAVQVIRTQLRAKKAVPVH